MKHLHISNICVTDVSDIYRVKPSEARYCQGKLFVSPSVCLSVCDAEVSWSYRLELCENNFTAD